MGLVIDTDVLVLADRRRASVDFARWREYGTAYISAVTASELLVGVHRAQTDEQRNRRNAFVEGLLAAIPTLPFDLECARVHSHLVASLPRNETVGAHDALIAATALRHGHAVLTNNGKDFRKLAGVSVVDYVPGEEASTGSSMARAVRGVSKLAAETVDFDPMRCWSHLAQIYTEICEKAGCAQNSRSMEGNLHYLENAFAKTEELWHGQFEKMDRVRAVILSEAPLFGEKETYFYNPKAKPTSFFYLNDAEAVPGEVLADGEKGNPAETPKERLIKKLTSHCVLILDLFPYALNPIDTAINFRTLRKQLYIQLFGESASAWLKPKLDAIRRKSEKPKFLFRYRRVQERLERELRRRRILRQDDEVESIYGKNMSLDRDKLAKLLGVDKPI